MTKGLMLEPGSKMSVTARLRRRATSNCMRSFGLNEGWLTIASTSPVAMSSTITVPACALYSRIADFSSRYARYWMRRSMLVCSSSPCSGAFRTSTSWMTCPRPSWITRFAPSLPASERS